eukprot:gb/GFBE01041622.1/.p1 GENE.gb/GFBE01041622.1/~~gb/GFBE01041622.1/.p1  ORF type:complete len:735 (+),score=169.57 gb/GFBE01041622.1/:1-2205(+)
MISKGSSWSLAALLLASDFPAAVSEEAPATGLSTCQCLGTSWSPKDTHPNSIENDKLILKTAGATYLYPLTYGQNCGMHDNNLPPLCNQASANPEWCTEKWCYVDKSTCSLFYAKSQFFPDENNLHYSYATCNGGASSNSFEKWAGMDVDGNSRMLDLMARYLQSSREQIESSHAQQGNPLEPCAVSTTCPCLECSQDGTWKNKIDFSDVGVYDNPLSKAASCLANSIAYTYRRVAAKEGNRERIGYQYFSDQDSGAYVGWPNTDWCPNNYDPRYRPWYAAGATGPKDVVIVVDVSGSMQTAGRSNLARQATKAILDTLTWKDFATIILFNSDIDAVFSTKMVSVTDEQRDAMKSWVDRGDWNHEGTNFQAAMLGERDDLPGAFKIIRDSVSQGQTSMCQKIVMFLTDGQAEFTEGDYQRTQELATQYHAVIFTYALGSGADASVSKRLACDNNGIFYPVPDNADLATVMADYYKYFADGQQSCTPSFVEYTDAVTGTSLVAGCLPMYDRTNPRPALLGVSCMDINMLADVEQLKKAESWAETISIASDVSKKCRPIDMSECHLQKLRLKYSAESVCPAGPSVNANTKCPCLEQGCSDDPDFIDEKGYFCDTWVGDSCDQASSVFGYSAAGEAQVKSKCRHSCGLCQWYDICPYTTTTCTTSSLPTKSRACQTDTVTGVDIEGCKMACLDPSNPRYAGTRTCTAAVSAVGQSSMISLLAMVLSVAAAARATLIL